MPDAVDAARARTGGCLCGMVRFSVAGPPDDPHLCVCAHCRKRAGAPFQWWVGFPQQHLTWVGGIEPTWYDTYPCATRRGFCPVCGSHIAAVDYANDAVVGLLVTALDDQDDPLLVPGNLHRLREAADWLGLPGSPAG